MEPEEGRSVRVIEDDEHAITFFFEGWRLVNIDIEVKDYTAVPPMNVEHKAHMGQWCGTLYMTLRRMLRGVPPLSRPLPAGGDGGKATCPRCKVELEERPCNCPSQQTALKCPKCGMQYKAVDNGAKEPRAQKG